MTGFPFFPDVPKLPGIPSVPRFPTSAPQASSFTASIAENVMNVTSVTNGALYAGSRLTAAAGLVNGTAILQQVAGVAGGAGQYLIDVAQSYAGTIQSLFSPPAEAADEGEAEDDSQDAGQAEAPRWGIFDASGAMVVSADNVVTVEYRQEWAISDYPLEAGAFESYDKVFVPFDARVRFSRGGSLASRQELLDSVAAIAGDLNLYDVVTPEQVYQGANIIHQSTGRAARDGVGLVKVDVWLQQVKANAAASFSTPQASSVAPITSPKAASATSTKNDGTRQLTAPTADQAAAFLSPLGVFKALRR
jgi:hypothetical protein